MHLRVWFRKDGWEARPLLNGIVISGDNTLNVRNDDGKFYRVSVVDIEKSEWVNHPESGE